MLCRRPGVNRWLDTAARPGDVVEQLEPVDPHMELLKAAENRFNGVDVDADSLPQDAEFFAASLEHSVACWREQGKRVIWLEIPAARARLIPVAVEAGFVFHHTSTEYLMLTRRLDEKAHVPDHATHYIGAGGVVLDTEGNLLTVVERYYRTAGQPPRYKLPGGALQQGEHLADGVIREIREETGIDTVFESVVCFRHWHGYRYGKSDIYFVCRLHPLNHEICRQEEEIAECRWMPVDEYLQQAHVSPFNQRVVQAALTSTGLITESIEGYGDQNRYEIFKPAPPTTPG
jgi:8-oxo-dGTP pyrophosphatase MutT (NUDIX family)